DTFGLTPVLRRAHLALLSSDEDLLIGDDPVVIQPPPDMPENLKVTFTVSKPGHDAFLPVGPRYILYLHTEWGAKVGTVGRTVKEPHPLSSVGCEFLNRLQVQNAVRYIVLNDAAQRDVILPMLHELEHRFFLFRNLFDK
ncbi:DUF4238 domain-containing protein, partial [Streptomyces sp. NPDC051577]|uniref:DUF4238 domain-containing protein n=1 Tax=Streptomyces sp. NPDC051577 TaxID=3155166 RepID=UPI003415B5CF